MTITLYELSGADRSLRFAPHCWKSKLALQHKQLSFGTEPVWFTEKEKFALSGQPLLPVITDADKVVSDSWEIAQYLESTYPNKPSLFANEEAKAQAESFHQWVSSVLSKHIPGIIILDLFNIIAEQDKEYFRTSREARLGTSLEEFAATPEKHIQNLQTELAHARDLLKNKMYFGGDKPDYRDICLLGTFLWIASSGTSDFLAKDDVIYSWYQRVLEDYREVIPTSISA
ncbi:glutathione S-transferase N-terminal domain-containing protein [Aliiglaciecola sp. 3_MG-2023]|uniref:glutathione S-transferase N-terminal domain-containing protein n=1 Tax=Aliiglaciecola sp. 3_MG-2023 TaxID=3062644 RepID=UPI0026E450B9|nr:glutathione S-transferase N-terminal domain-containing protein [Aliiglaciecola sp. 3_MG-2023]MDO6691981.1 glutathione S-transferase N-terminal domain-containing protein [Aliiglaciecola sp. 3_MG-2023]